MLQSQAIEQLQGIKLLLNQIEDSNYALPIATLKNSSIGSHIRHTLELYTCLLTPTENDVVNYETRKRKVLLETNTRYAIDYLTEVCDKLELISINKSLIHASSFNTETYLVETSLYREIAYNIEHTTHHLAIISIAIGLHFPSILLPTYFGYAASTIKHLKEIEISK